MIRYIKFGLACTLWIATVTTWAADGNLKVGASRIDITPASAELPAPYAKVHDKIYVRTILLNDGKTKAAVVIVDVPMIDGAMYADFAKQISQQAGCPPWTLRGGSGGRCLCRGCLRDWRAGYTKAKD
jgi:neutral ceramidase